MLTSGYVSVLDPNNYSPIWISWADSKIRIGTGDQISEEEVMSWEEAGMMLISNFVVVVVVNVIGIGIGVCL